MRAASEGAFARGFPWVVELSSGSAVSLEGFVLHKGFVGHLQRKDAGLRKVRCFLRAYSSRPSTIERLGKANAELGNRKDIHRPSRHVMQVDQRYITDLVPAPPLASVAERRRVETGLLYAPPSSSAPGRSS